MLGRITHALCLMALIGTSVTAQQLDPRRSTYSNYRGKNHVLRGYPVTRIVKRQPVPRMNRVSLYPVSRSYRQELSRAQRPLATTRPSLPARKGDCHPGATVYRSRVATPRYAQYRPVVTLTRMPGQYFVGRGIIGQPKVYVPGQPVRNFFRYISP